MLCEARHAFLSPLSLSGNTVFAEFVSTTGLNLTLTKTYMTSLTENGVKFNLVAGKLPVRILEKMNLVKTLLGNAHITPKRSAQL